MTNRKSQSATEGYASARGNARPSQAPESAESTRPSRPASLASITLLYESRDGKLCLFEDAQGHLTAVRASRLA